MPAPMSPAAQLSARTRRTTTILVVFSFLFSLLPLQNAAAMPSAPVQAAPDSDAVDAPAASQTWRFNFQPDAVSGTPVPAPLGYVKDIGLAFDGTRGYGWIREDSVGTGASVPLGLEANSRDRNVNPDQRLDTFQHMQFPPSSTNATAVKTPAAWELAVPNGAYTVTLAVGDPTLGGDPETHTINVEGVNAINAFPRSAAGNGTDARHLVATVAAVVSDGLLTIDAIGGTNTKLNFVDVIAGQPELSQRYNFELATSRTPIGYTRDSGLGFDAGRGFGWVRADSLAGDVVPLDISGNTRDRAPTTVPTVGSPTDQRLDTLVHIQAPASSTMVKDEAAWEAVVANGWYTVTVAVGDAPVGADLESHEINVEGVKAVDDFMPSGSAGALSRHQLATVTVPVTDGRLTIDPLGGTNTKLHFVELVKEVGTPPPPPPTNQAPVVTDPGAQTDAVDEAIDGLQLAATDADGDAVTFTVSGLPAGLTAAEDGSGLISGTPTAVGDSTVTVTASDGTVSSSPLTFTWTIEAAASTNQAPVVTDPGEQTDTVDEPIADLQLVATDPDGDPIVSYAAEGIPPGLSLDAGTGVISGTPDSVGDSTVTVTASDGTDTSAPVNFTWTIEAASAPPDCGAWSILPCDQLGVDLPLALEFGTDAGGLADKNGLGTGFSLIQPSSNGGAYLPANLTVENGQLKIATTNGIQFRTATLGTNSTSGSKGNGLDNGLGVAFDAASGTTRIEATVVNPPGTTNSSQQGGLWFGLNEDNYLKLVVVSTGTNTVKVQALREQNGGVTSNTTASSDLLEYNSANLAAAQTFRLVLTLDPATNTVAATAFAGTTAVPMSHTALGTLTPFTLPATWFRTGPAASDATSLTSAGLFATHRNGPSSLSYAFGEFTISEVDATPPATPSGLTATAGDGSVALTWNASTEPDLAGYRVYRGTSTPVSTSGTPLSGSGLLSSAVYADTSAPNGTIYHYAVVAVDEAGNASPAATASAMPDLAEPVAVSLPLQVNFQNQTGPTPTGYVADYGQNYANGRGFGWVSPGSSDPLSLVGNGRDRNRAGIAPELNTLIHMQGDDVANFSGVATPGAWELAVPDGDYDVTVSVGDQPGANSIYDSQHSINVEGTVAIDAFQATAAEEFEAATVTVTVTDGKLTLDASGGFNTKPNYVVVAPAEGTPENTPPILTQPGAQVSEEGEAVSLQLDATDAEDAQLAWSASGLPAGLEIDAASGIITGSPALGSADGSPYSVFVTVTDTASATDTKGFSWTVLTAAPTDCGPWSILPCDQLGLEVPVALDFDGGDGGLKDTGFTLVQPSSNGGEYLPDNLTVEDGLLKIATTNGIQYRSGTLTGNANSLDNGLGVAFDAASGATRIESTVINPPAGTNQSQQAGMWFGLNEDNYLKLVVVSTGTSTVKVQVLREQNGGVLTADLLEYNSASTLNPAQTFAFALDLDPNSNTATASFTANGSPISLTNATGAAMAPFTLPAAWFRADAASASASALTSAGLFATHRGGPSSLTYSFGEFTISASGGSDTTPPAAPSGLVATPGDGQVHLSWSPNAEADFAGYNVYRSLVLPVSTSGTPLNGSSPQTSTSIVDSSLTNGTTYYYVVEALDAAGNAAISDPIGATPQQAATDVDVKVNFQNGAAATPTGYLRDFGEGFGPRTATGQGTGMAFGWVIPGTDTPRDLSVGGTTPGNGRDRNLNADQRLDTLMHMQADNVSGTFNGTALPGAWEIALPNGVYAVTVAVGDAAANNLTTDPEFHTINVEGNSVVYRFVPSGAAGANTRHATATALITVADGRLTVDAINGQNTKINYIEISSDTDAALRPSVTGTNPTNGATNVPLDAFVAVDVRLPNAGNGVDASTLTDQTVRLYPTAGGPDVLANRNTTGGRDAIVLQPSQLLQPSTNYTFVVTDGVKDETGAAFIPYQMSFTTSANAPGGGGGVDVTFEKVLLPNTRGQNFTTLTMGPDDKLYASTIAGQIYRFGVNADGTLQNPETISSLVTANGGVPRMLIGITFDPSSTADNLVLWASHSLFGFSGMPDWGGKITRLSGPNLATVQDYVINLPRSCRDHLTNGIAFGPDGAMYVNQGSNSAMGAADNAWCNRPERQLSGAVLRIDLNAISSPPLNVKTEEGGTYNAMATGAPLTVYGSGVRNAYDLVWHSNGSLYVPTNGSAAGGNTPGNTPGTPETLPASCQNRVDSDTNGAYTGPAVPAINGVNQTQPDFLFRVVEGGYYGHPNPQRCEWVLNGGNPTAGSDPAQVSPYPVGVAPDRNWRAFAFDFANNNSPNGVIEYQSNIFNGALRGKILVARFSGGDDIMVLVPGASGDIVDSQVAIPGFTGFKDPLDLTEDTRNGNLYVSEYDQSGSGQQITLVRPVGAGSAATPDIAADVDRLLYNDVAGGAPSAAKSVIVSNQGNEPLTVSSIGLVGAGAAAFAITGQPTLPATVAAGGSITVAIAFNPSIAGPTGAGLAIASDDPDSPTYSISLRGLGTAGLGGVNEPSLQWILDTYEIPVNAGDDNTATNILHSSQATSPLLGDEVSIQHFVRAEDGPVSVEPIAVFGPQDSGGSVTTFGWYASSASATVLPLFTAPNASYQSIEPTTSGSRTFDPGTTAFGFTSNWPFFDDRQVYSQDTLNTWEPNASARHKVRVYPMRTASGELIANTYLVATEEHTSGFDYQDVVVIVSNVKPAPGTAPALSASPDELVFSGVKGTTSAARTVVVTNTGLADATISGASLTGTNASSFGIASQPALPLTLGPSETAIFEIVFSPGSTIIGSLSAGLALTTTASYDPIGLYGLSANGLEGSNEPPLKQVVDTLGYPIDVGGTGLILGTGATPIGDEIVAPLFAKAGTGSVGITAVARYSPVETLPYGYYVLDNAAPLHTVVATIQSTANQTLNPAIVSGGGSSFDPGAQHFGIFVDSLSFGRKSYTQDGLNTGPTSHAARIYPLLDRDGAPMPNTYLVAFEDAANGDYQDYVFVLTNVSPVNPGSGGDSGNINFQPDSVAVPDGYAKDIGLGFDATRGYGWVAPGTSTPVDMTLSTRQRATPADPLLQTLILMQGSGAATQPNVGSWEYALPNGTYDVTVTVGDAAFTDSTHRILAEGTVLIDSFVPTASDLFETGTGSVTVSDGRLTIAATGGTNTKLTHLQIGGLGTGELDTTPPTVDVSLLGSLLANGDFRNSVTVGIEAADEGGSGLAAVAYSLNGADYVAYSEPFEITSAGDYTVAVRAIDGAGNTTTSAPRAFKVVYAEPTRARIALENLDGDPFDDRLVFNRIQNPEDGTTLPANVVHDVATVRVSNSGVDPLTVTGLDVTPASDFVLDQPISLPAVVPSGGTLDVAVRFIATQGSIRTGTLTIDSDDPTARSTEVELAGFWQSISEGNQEPTFVETLQTFGYGTTVLGPGQSLNTAGALVSQGDEILSPYWQRANTTQPVTVRQLAAFHTQGNTATFYWTPKSQYNGTAVLTHVGVDGQSFYPRKTGTGNPPGVSSFTPSQAVFGFRSDPEHSDYAVNTAQGRAQVDYDQGCVAPCGHHLRAWPARDRAGAIIANTYVLTMDYAGINYDFNDNVYIVSNIKPENLALDPSAPAPLPGAPSLRLEFDEPYIGTLADKDGQTTGFTGTQANRLDLSPGSDSYVPALLDVDTAAGVLSVTTTLGSNANNDNTLVNGLQRSFDGTTGTFTAETRLVGPLTALNAGSRQGGVMFGSDQDNYVKVVAINKGGVPSIELFSEQNGVGATVGTTPAIPSPSTLTSLDLMLVGDPASGTVRAAYRVNDGALNVLPTGVTLSAAQRGRFFASNAKAGLITMHKGATEFAVTFDRFAVVQGDLTSSAADGEALYRLDVAGSADYTDGLGRVWTPDAGLFTPTTAINEGATTQPLEIANTDDDPIYRTYRGNVGNVPMLNRVLSYELPLRGLQTVDLRLHFAERASGNAAIGARVFDIEADGVLLKDNFDIYAAAGAINTAITLDLPGVVVADGVLNLSFRPSADYASIAGIEVLCDGACPEPDAEAPAPPSDLTAEASSAGINLSWLANGEPDLAGYHVYRAANQAGPFERITTTLLSGSAYTDATAPAGAEAFYVVTAIDLSGNESDDSTGASATMPSQVPGTTTVRLNAGGPAQTVNGVTWSACSATTACSGSVTGGFAYTQSPLPTITGAAPPTNQTIHQSEWTGGQAGPAGTIVPIGSTAFTFDIPVTNGTYLARLHFTELNKNGAGLRVFDVNLEGGAKELVNFDVFVEAGGINRAIYRDFPLNITDGDVTIDFIRQVENAKVSAIEILPVAPADAVAPLAPSGLGATGDGLSVDLEWVANTEADLAGYFLYRAASENGPFTKVTSGLITDTFYTDTTAPADATSFYRLTAVDASGNESVPSGVVEATTETPPAPAVLEGINAGSSAGITGGDLWGTNQYFTGGKSYTNPSVTSIAGTTDDVLYLTERSATANLGSFSYAIPVPSSQTYTVRLHFAEIYWGATGGGAGGTGQRIFSVNLEGGSVELANYDLNADVPPMTAVVKSFQIPVTDGTLNLAFTASVNQPKISAIEVLSPEVPATNQDPVMGAIADPTTLDEGTTTGITLSATDADEQPLTFSLSPLPSFATLTNNGDGTALLSLAPDYDDAGVHLVTVSVSDGAGGSDSQSITISVNDVNRDPVLTNPGTQSDGEGDVVDLAAAASDPDGDVLSFTATGLPTGLSVDAATGAISGTIAAGASGLSPFSVELTVDDGRGGSASATFTWTVTAASDVTPPSAPDGLTASLSSVAITLQWSPNEELDLAGYHVYRSGSVDGTYERLNGAVLTSPTYVDATAPRGATSFYRVTAVDISGNESEFAATSAERGIAFRAAATRAGTGTSLSIPRPTGTQQGDLMLATLVIRGNPMVTAPMGWSIVRSDVNGAGLRQVTYMRVAGSSEPASNAWSFSQSVGAAGIIAGYSGVDPTNPIDVNAGSVNASSSSMRAASVTTNVDDALLVTLFGIATNASVTPPSGMVEQAEATMNSGANKVAAELSDAILGAAGVTGDRLATASKAAVSIGHTVALRPLGAPPATDTEDPSVPAGLNAVAISSTQIDLTWAPATDNVGVSLYRIYRDGNPVGTSATPRFSDTGLSADTEYSYWVEALDVAGNVSDPSQQATARTLPATAPAGIAFVGSASAANGGAATLSIPAPAGASSGHFLLASIDVAGDPTIIAPAGWSLVGAPTMGGGAKKATFWRIASAGMPASFVWTFSGSHAAAGVMVAYSGVDSDDPIDAFGGQANASSTSITAPSVTSTGDGRVVGFFGILANGSITPPSGMTERAEIIGSGRLKVASEAADRPTGAGSTEVLLATASKAAANIGHVVVLRAAEPATSSQVTMQ